MDVRAVRIAYSALVGCGVSAAAVSVRKYHQFKLIN